MINWNCHVVVTEADQIMVEEQKPDQQGINSDMGGAETDETTSSGGRMISGDPVV